MGFATKNNFAISLVQSECSQGIMGQSAEQYKHHNKHNRLGNMSKQGLLGAQMVRYAPCDIGIDKGEMCLVVMVICILIGLRGSSGFTKVTS